MAFFDDRKYKDDDWGGMAMSPFYGIEKGAVLQDCRAAFNQLQLEPERCEEALVRLLFLVGQGETLTSDEATTVFFAVTKLFQSNEPGLRRLVYLAIKELAHTAEEVIIVTNCLTKDINSDVDMYRANATRVLCKITDPQMVQAIERYLKQEIVDRNPVVASSALVSAQQLILHNKGDVVRRWVNEITQTLEHRSPMVQYHALALLYQIKQHDRLAVTRLVQSMARSSNRTPMATVLVIRYAARLISEVGPPPAGQPRPFFDILEAGLRHRSDVVVYEAARVIVDLPHVTSSELQPVVSVVQLFLTQPKSVLRMAAMRTLVRISLSHPVALAPCQGDMEALIGDSNRSIATLAITALLRTASETSIDRLLKQIQSFLSDIADEFKIKVVDAIHALCLKYPSKHYSLLNFLGSALREEGGFDFKRAIVTAYLGLMQTIPESKEMSLSHLCEFIEDCEHTQLSTQILHLLGKEGPAMPDPGKFIRYIYNRLILENATVRAAAVSALASFAGVNAKKKLNTSVGLLLRQSLNDSEDEVRDRSSFYIASLGLDCVAPENQTVATADISKLPCPISSLEYELIRYTNSGRTSLAFDIGAVSKAAVPTATFTDAPGESLRSSTNGETSAKPAQTVVDVAQNVMKVPELVELGRPFKSSAEYDLTEEETEYNVKCVRHVYEGCLVLEFIILNTLNDQQLDNVVVDVDADEIEGISEIRLIAAKSLTYGKPGSAYTVLEPKKSGAFLTGTMTCTLKYTVKDVDLNTGEIEDEGYEDDYQLEDLTISAADLIAAPAELPTSFVGAWGDLGGDNEVVDSFTLSAYNSIPTAVPAVIACLGLVPCEGTERASARSHSHTLLLTGIVVPGIEVMVKAEIIAQENGVLLSTVVRAESMAVSELITSCIA